MDVEENDSELEPIFIAANVREAAQVEQLLTLEGIEYSVRPHSFVRANVAWTTEFQGILFEVLGGQASYCRKLLIGNGLKSGVVPAEGENSQ